MVDKLSDQQIEELKEAFGMYDERTGMIDTRDLSSLLKAIGHNPTEDEARNIIDQLDSNETGSIDFPEFLAYVARKQREVAENPEELIEAMTVFDKTGSGFLDKEVLEDMILNNGEGLSPPEAKEFINSLKYNAEGKISFDDFMRLVYNEKQMN